MGLISQIIDHLLGGVSQKPAYRRDPSECNEQVNGFALWGKALLKRPPCNHLAKLTSTTTRMSEAFVHSINRDGIERYHVIIAAGDLKVYDAVTGASKTVTFPNGKAYLTADAMGFRAVTIGDVTYITNRSVVTAKNTGTTVANRNPEGIVFVRQADFSTTYFVTVQGTTISHTTAAGTSAAQRANITTDFIATQLYNALVANGTLTAGGFSFTRIGSSIYMTRASAFTLVAQDGLADNAIYAVKDKIQRFEDLPAKAKHGMYIEVTGSPGSLYDNYFVTYDNSANDGVVGVWKETVKTGENYQFDFTTLPCSLTRNSDGTFTFAQVTWRNREVGSLVTNPYASFIGKPIKDVFFYKGRLGFLAGEHIILSQANSVTNFWRQSAKDLFDNDLIDITAAFPQVTNFHTFLEWNNIPLLWANNAQVTFDSGDVMSPKTAGLTLITSYENQSNIRPVVVGGRLFFAQIVNNVTRMAQFYIDNQTGKPKARDLTEDQPTYLQGSPRAMIGTEQPGILAVTMDGRRQSLYIYNFAYEGDQQLQGAWSRWDFAFGKVVGLDVAAGSIGVILLRADGVYLERISLSDITKGTPASRIVTGFLGRGTSSGTLPNSEVNWSFDQWENAAGNGVGGDFEYTQGAGHGSNSKTQNLYLDKAVYQAAITIVGANFADNAVNFYDGAGNLLGTLTTWSTSVASERKSFASPGIRRIEFVPHAAGDYVSWMCEVTTSADAPVYLDHQNRFYPANATSFLDTFTGVDGTLLTAHSPDYPTAAIPPFYGAGGAFWKLLSGTAVPNSFPAGSLTKAIIGTGGGAAFSVGEEVWCDLTFPASNANDEMGFSFMDNGAGDYCTAAVKGIASGTQHAVLFRHTYVGGAGQTQTLISPITDGKGRLGVTILSNTSWQVWQENTGGGSRAILFTHTDAVTPSSLAYTGWGLYVKLGSGNGTGFAWDNLKGSLPSTTSQGGSFNGSTGTFTLPYAIATDGSEGEVVVFRVDTGVEVACTRPSSTTAQVTIDLSGTEVVVGVRYTFIYTLTDLYIRRQTRAGGINSEAGGRTTIRYITFLLQDTADLTVTVSPDGRSPYTYTYHKTTTLPSDRFQVPVQAKNDTVDIVVTNPTPNGCSLAGLDWEANFTIRNQRQ